MNKKIFCIVSFLFCLALANSILRADKIDDLIRDVPGLEKYPDASAIHVYSEVILEVNPDFSFKKRVFNIKKILTYKGKKRYSDVKLSYNADFEKLELGRCFSIDPEGKRISIPKNQISDLTTQQSIHNPMINFRETIINFPRIEPGYFIVTEFTLFNDRKEPVNGIEHFRGSNPFMYKKFSIKFPEQLRLNTHFDHNKLSFSETRGKKFHVYTWEVKNTRIIKSENNSPPYMVSGIPVGYSFYKNWQELAREKLSKIVNVKSDDSVIEMARKITAGCKTAEEKVLAIYNYLAENFNYELVYMSQIDFRPRPLAEIIRDKKGSIRDLTALFIVLLRSVGIKDVYPALTLSDYLRYSGVQKKLAINSLIDRVCVFWDSRLFHPGRGFIPFGFCLYETSVIIGNKNFDMIHYQSPNRLIEQKRFMYEIKGNSALVSVRMELADMWNMQFRRVFKDQPQVRRKIWFNQMLREKAAVLVQGPDFKNFDRIEENLKLEYKLEYRDFFIRQDSYTYFRIFPPFFYLDVSLTERENDFQIYTKTFSREKFFIKMDKNMKFINPIESRKFEFKIGDRVAYYLFHSQQTETGITLLREIYVPEGLIKKERYLEFKRFILNIQNPLNNMIFLEE